MCIKMFDDKHIANKTDANTFTCRIYCLIYIYNPINAESADLS